MNTFRFRIPMRFLLAAVCSSVVQTSGAQNFADPDVLFATPINQTTQFEVIPFYGYRFGGEVEDSELETEYDFEGGPAFGVCLSYAPPEYHGRIEVLWSHQDSSIDFQGNNGLGDVDMMVDVIQIGGVSEYGSKDFRAYISAHVGATQFTTDGLGSDTRFSFGIGGGLKVFLTRNLFLCGDLRGFCTVVDADGAFIYYNGVSVATFSGSTMWQGQASAGVGLTF